MDALQRRSCQGRIVSRGSVGSSYSQCLRIPSSRRVLVSAQKTESSGASDAVNEFGRAAHTKFNSFVKDATPKVQSAFEDMKSNARRTYSKLDSEYDISEKANRAAKRVKETAQDVDQQYGVRRRLRTWLDNWQRAWPVWSRRFEEFSATPVGKFTVIAGVIGIMATPIFWRVLNWVIFLWWLALPLATFVLQRAQFQQAQQAAAEEEERRRNPFASFFKGASGRTTGMGGANSRGDSRSSKSTSQFGGGGPVIEAEWTPLDSDKKK